jgi:predicted nucleotidyltransferase
MDEQIKNIITDSLIGNEISKIILFGSRARDNFDENSDYDILIVLKNRLNRKDLVYYKSLIRKKLAKIDIAADILINSIDYVNKASELNGNVIKFALQEGKVL